MKIEFRSFVRALFVIGVFCFVACEFAYADDLRNPLMEEVRVYYSSALENSENFPYCTEMVTSVNANATEDEINLMKLKCSYETHKYIVDKLEEVVNKYQGQVLDQTDKVYVPIEEDFNIVPLLQYCSAIEAKLETLSPTSVYKEILEKYKALCGRLRGIIQRDPFKNSNSNSYY